MSAFSDKERERLAREYSASISQKKINVLVTGEHGTGKTQLARTARKPVHIDSFDPGGTKGLADLIRTGAITVDTEFEEEDPLEPRVFARWRNMLDHRIDNKYFDDFGTYFIDSATFLLESIMGWSIKEASKDKSRKFMESAVPKWNTHYSMQKHEINKALRRILNLKCDVFMTAHLRERYEPAVGANVIEQAEENTFLGYRFFCPGQAAIVIPTMFDEIWVTLAESYNPAQRTVYKILTEKSGAYLAKSRLGRGILDAREEPDVKKILEKLGWDTKDKPFKPIGSDGSN